MLSRVWVFYIPRQLECESDRITSWWTEGAKKEQKSITWFKWGIKLLAVRTDRINWRGIETKSLSTIRFINAHGNLLRPIGITQDQCVLTISMHFGWVKTHRKCKCSGKSKEGEGEERKKSEHDNFDDACSKRKLGWFVEVTKWSANFKLRQKPSQI